MEELISESMAGFDSLWQRVTGQEEPAPAARPPQTAAGKEEDALLLLIHDEICAGAWSAALARLFQGEGRAVLARHAADAKRHLRRLRAEHYILTGVDTGGNQDCRAIAGRPALLRAAFLQAEEMAGRYAQLAESAAGGELREVCAAFAEEERRRARELRALLVESF